MHVPFDIFLSACYFEALRNILILGPITCDPIKFSVQIYSTSLYAVYLDIDRGAGKFPKRSVYKKSLMKIRVI